MRADEIAEAKLEDDWPDEHVEACRLLGATLGSGCRQSQPRDGGGRLEGLDARTGSEMMRLVRDQEAEPVAEPVHVTERALEREDGHAFDAPLSVADEADGLAQTALELGDPRGRERSRRA